MLGIKYVSFRVLPLPKSAMLWLHVTASSVTISSKSTSHHILFGQCIRLTLLLFHTSDCIIVLDPRINYKGLSEDHTEEPDFLEHIEDCKRDLESHYAAHYASKVSLSTTLLQPSVSTSSALHRTSSSLTSSPVKIDFTARYAIRQPATERNELEEYFRLMPEVWEECDPVTWWGARRPQFPNLSRLARDVMSIPGIARFQ